MYLKIALIILLLPLKSLSSSDFYPSKYSLAQAQIALQHMKKGDWSEALYYAVSTGDPTVKKIFLTKYYSASEAKIDLKDLQNFIIQNPKWPGISEIRKRIEENLNFSENKIDEIISWFNKYPPISSQGTKILAEAKFRKHINSIKFDKNENIVAKEEVRNLIRNAWLKGNFSPKEEADFLVRYDHLLSQKDHINRIDRLLWQDQISQAERIIHKVNKDYQKLFKARIGIAQNPKKIKQILVGVPASLKHTPGLIYQQIVWNQKEANHAKAIELLAHAPKDHAHVKNWWKVRNRAIREALEEKNYKVAYNLVKNRGKLDPKDEPEAEWLAGWISYSFLKNPQIAYNHFQRIYNLSQFPINKARGAYWMAKAARKMNKKDLANKWYKVAANYNFTFYGQLASLKVSKDAVINFCEAPKYKEDDHKRFINNEFAKAAYISAYLNLKEDAKKYLFAALDHAKTEGEYILIASMPRDLKEKWLSVETAKALSRKGIILTDYNYPQLDFVKECTQSHAFAHAIMRQESVFDVTAVSPAGAYGIMQIMPNTGKLLAKEMDIDFSEDQLLNNHKYNIKLGSYLLEKLLIQYKGSYILAAAAYNAGESAVNKWIQKYGDPRNLTKTRDILNWIEHIPYYETRNYVLRILENMQIYKSINQTDPKRIGLKSDLKGIDSQIFETGEGI